MSKREIIEKLGEEEYNRLKKQCDEFMRQAFGPNYRKNKLCKFVKSLTRGKSYLERMRTTILILTMFKEQNIGWRNIQDALMQSLD